MKVAIASYPMLWQRTGGLQIQILKTLEQLRSRGIDARIFDPINDRFSNFDIAHVFAAINGNHLLLREAKAQGIKTVLSPLLQPEASPFKFKRYALSSWLTGRLSNYEIRTTFDNIRSALEYSDHLIALSTEEERILRCAYNIENAKITCISNGIDPSFFTATPDAFLRAHRLSPGYVLVVGSISPYKNQLGVIRHTTLPVVLIGPVSNETYLKQCLKEGGPRVVHLGTMHHDDPLLASAYAAAGVTVLASAGETFGLTAVESLAAGTPAVITRSNGLGIPPTPPCLQFIDPENETSLRDAIERGATAPGDRATMCRDLVSHFTWPKVSSSIETVYQSLNGLSRENINP